MKLTHKYVWLLLALAVLAGLVAGCGGARSGDSGSGGSGGGGEDEYTLRLVHELTPESVKGLTAEKFKELVESKTEGKVKVEVYPNGELYGGTQAISAVQDGSAEMSIVATGDFTNLAPELDVMGLPFVVEELEDVIEVTAPGTPIGRLLRDNETLAENNIQVLSVYGSGIKQISTNVEPRTLEDMSKQRIRVQQSPVEKANFEAWGANPVPIDDFGEVYSSLEQGVIDGQTNPYSTIVSESIYEVQDYILELNGGYTAYLAFIGKDFLNSMPEDLQTAVQEAADETQEYAVEVQAEEAEKAKKTILEEGDTEIIEIDGPERQAFKEAVIPDMYRQFTDVFGEELVEELIEREQEEMQETSGS